MYCGNKILHSEKINKEGGKTTTKQAMCNATAFLEDFYKQRAE